MLPAGDTPAGDFLAGLERVALGGRCAVTLRGQATSHGSGMFSECGFPLHSQHRRETPGPFRVAD